MEPLDATAANSPHGESRILAQLVGVDGVPQPGAIVEPGAIALSQAIQDKPLGIAALLSAAQQLAAIVAAIHRRGVLHQNINPANILLHGEPPVALLIGFQLATALAEARPVLTHQNIQGALAYVAPELTGRTGHPVDQRADLYALGATLYEMAVGHPPFQADDALQLIHDHLARVPPPPRDLRPELPPPLSDVILRLLEKDPARRYQSAQGLCHDLGQLCRQHAQGDSLRLDLGTRDFAARLGAPSQLVGRDADSRVLREALQEVLQGGSRVVLVSGPSGVGKTSLINELRPLVTARGGWFVAGKFDQYRQDTFSATGQALRGLGRLLLAEPENRLAAQRSAILQALGPNAGLAVGLPEFATLLGPQPKVPTIDPQRSEARLLLSMLALLQAIVSVERPVVMMLDDLQWAPVVSIRFIDALLAAKKMPGLLLVGAYRDAELEAAHPLSAVLSRWARLERPPLALRLTNLPPVDLAALLAEMLRMPAAQAAELAHAIATHTGGNPYDTVELVNSLRHDGTLLAGPAGWEWDADALRRFIGHGTVIDLLVSRISRLPAPGRALLEAMACLGGEVSFSLLLAATQLPQADLEHQMAAPIEEGLLVLEETGECVLRFRHDRVQQAAYSMLDPARLRALHLGFARQLAPHAGFAARAAEQYLAALSEVVDAGERRQAVNLLRKAALMMHRSANFALVERFLAGAQQVLEPVATQDDRPLLMELETGRHAALYSLGLLEEADEIYRSIERRRQDDAQPLDLVEATCIQVASLSNRDRQKEAVGLGRALLERLGVVLRAPDPPGQRDPLHEWPATDGHNHDLSRPEVADTRVKTVAKLINCLNAPAFFSDRKTASALVLEARALWVRHGPCADLLPVIASKSDFGMAERQDFRAPYNTARYALAVGEGRGYEPQTSWVRFLFAGSMQLWFEPIESAARQGQLARDGLLRGGDLQTACASYYVTICANLETAPTLDTCAGEIEAGLSFAKRTGNHVVAATCLPYRQLLRALRGETRTGGSFEDAEFSESGYVDGVGTNMLALAIFHINRALSALLFGDMPGLQRHALAAMPLLRFQQGFYPTALAHMLHCLAMAQRLRATPPAERAAVLAQMDASREWLARRAADAPFNFLHLVSLADAERAWATDDFAAAARLFDQALREVEVQPRPWHRALITERAGLFHLAGAMERGGRLLLADAVACYQEWGAVGKAQHLAQSHSGLQLARALVPSQAAGFTAGGSVDAIDTLAILRASQALSSETSLARLKARVVELLAALTGATTVRLALWDEGAGDWFLSGQQDTAPIAVDEAAARGLLPLTAFRYAERTREPLLVEDAVTDDRFTRDPYLAGMPHCSLLIVPILYQGMARAVLLVENQLSRGAFSPQRLDAVLLIAGQLAVSLENALLYERLEERVRDQTQALRHAQAELVASARRAGKAEIATNVLHNVGNVLNSVNVSAELLRESLGRSRVGGLAKAVQLIETNAADLGTYLTHDDQGRQLPGYLQAAIGAVAQEHANMLEELDHLTRSVDHIKEVVAMQQSYAGNSSIIAPVQICELVEDALRINQDALARGGVKIVKEFAEIPVLQLDRARIVQILVNLISNARNAMEGLDDRQRSITIRVFGAAPGMVRVSVRDEGEGIRRENLTRIFGHGFTTRASGHGFGLHSCALAATQMGGSLSAHSDGPGTGATFTLELPLGAELGDGAAPG